MSEPGLRELASAAQHSPLAVRTMIVAEPGRLPLCHQLWRELTAQPLAYPALACVAVVMDGEPVVLMDEEGHRTQPSVVAFSRDGSTVVGHKARKQLTYAPGSTVFPFNGQYYLSSGTSVATAYVSGLAGAMADPCKKTYASVESQIRQNLAVKKQ